MLYTYLFYGGEMLRKRHTIWLNEDEVKLLKEMAERKNRTQGEIVRTLIVQSAARSKEKA